MKSKIKIKLPPILQTNRPKEMKAWQDCQWQRVPCGLDSCPICGRIKRARQKHLDKGEDPDTMAAVFQDVGNVFKETLELLKKDAARFGIDLDKIKDMEENKSPEPSDFPLYNRAKIWRDGIYKIAEASDEVSSAWLYSQAGEDLLWYANTLLAKIYRQLSNVWELKNDKEKIEYIDLEYNYTGYVLNQVFAILDSALFKLSQDGGPQAGKFTLARLSLAGLKEKLK